MAKIGKMRRVLSEATFHQVIITISKPRAETEAVLRGSYHGVAWEVM
jgi:hypothetical protein